MHGPDFAQSHAEFNAIALSRSEVIDPGIFARDCKLEQPHPG
jgi:hypothetical protein